MEILAKRIRSLREGMKMSQNQIAKILGVTQASINRYETQVASPPLKTLLWYADYFDVSLDYLFGRTDNPEGKNFKYLPEEIKQKTEKNENLKEFVDMCFDPKSPMNDRLKNALLQVLLEEKSGES